MKTAASHRTFFSQTAPRLQQVAKKLKCMVFNAFQLLGNFFVTLGPFVKKGLVGGRGFHNFIYDVSWKLYS